jgi:hypothetical protein
VTAAHLFEIERQLAPWIRMKCRLYDIISIHGFLFADGHLEWERSPTVRQRWHLRRIDAMIAYILDRHTPRTVANSMHPFIVEWAQPEGTPVEPYA